MAGGGGLAALAGGLPGPVGPAVRWASLCAVAAFVLVPHLFLPKSRRDHRLWWRLVLGAAAAGALAGAGLAVRGDDPPDEAWAAVAAVGVLLGYAAAEAGLRRAGRPQPPPLPWDPPR